MAASPSSRANQKIDPAFRWRGDGVSRLEGLTDAVFAIVLALLFLRNQPPGSFDDLLANDDASLAEALRLRALAFSAAGYYDQAIADCREAVRLCPQLADVWRQLVDAYEQNGQLHRALVCLNHAIDLSPDDAPQTSDLRKTANRLRRMALTRAAMKTLRRAA